MSPTIVQELLLRVGRGADVVLSRVCCYSEVVAALAPDNGEEVVAAFAPNNGLLWGLRDLIIMVIRPTPPRYDP